jgi:hypothetical protein
MSDRRFESRMMCADLVDVQWKDARGRSKRTMANLEDISKAGICLQMETEVPLGASMSIHLPKGELAGRVRYCVFRDIGYFVGLEFDPGVKWSSKNFKPMHLFDPLDLVPERPARKRGSRTAITEQ